VTGHETGVEAGQGQERRGGEEKIESGRGKRENYG
jgi:hypothetical protein